MAKLTMMEECWCRGFGLKQTMELTGSPKEEIIQCFEAMDKEMEAYFRKHFYDCDTCKNRCGDFEYRTHDCYIERMAKEEHHGEF